jgi:hypothetical protein
MLCDPLILFARIYISLREQTLDRECLLHEMISNEASIMIPIHPVGSSCRGVYIILQGRLLSKVAFEKNVHSMEKISRSMIWIHCRYWTWSSRRSTD